MVWDTVKRVSVYWSNRLNFVLCTAGKANLLVEGTSFPISKTVSRVG